MRIEKTSFSKFSKFGSLRLSSYYELPEISFRYDDFYSFLSFVESGSRPKGGIKDEDNGQALSLGGEQIDRDGTVCLDKLPYVSYEYYEEMKKGIIKDEDILICKDGALTGKTCIVNMSLLPSSKVMINEHIFAVRANTRIRQKMLFYITRTDVFRNQVIDLAYRKKAQPGLTLEHLKAIKIPEIPLKVQEKILEDIKPYERIIEELNSKKVNIQKNIDKVFQKYFDFSYDEYEEIKKIKIYHIGPDSIADNGDLRCSPKFHRPARNFVEKELTSKMDTKIKDFLAEPIVLGASISPNDYNDGDYIYISMATIKTWKLDSEVASTVSKDFATRKQEKTVRKNDIILARSGEGTIGKVALVEDDVDGIFADFTMRIRLKNYNPEFAYYYFRTSYFQYLIETYKKGLGNNTNIFPVAIKEFPIPNIPLCEQEKVVKEIRLKIEEQETIYSEIVEQQNAIKKSIEELMCSAAGN